MSATPFQQMLGVIIASGDTPARRWLESQEVTAWCERSRAEREAEEMMQLQALAKKPR